MQAQHDPFRDVRDVEREARQMHRERVAHLRAAIALADGVIQLEGSSGYQSLHKSLQDMLEHRTAEMLTCRNDHDTNVAKGRCLELRAILSLVSNTRNNRNHLAVELALEEDRFAELSANFKPEPNKETS